MHKLSVFHNIYILYSLHTIWRVDCFTLFNTSISYIEYMYNMQFLVYIHVHVHVGEDKHVPLINAFMGVALM